MSVRSSRLPQGAGVHYGHTPHLAQWPLRDRLTQLLRLHVPAAAGGGRRPRVLELGAGHGGVTETLLALGCDVTVVEMSARSGQDAVVRHPGLAGRATLDTDLSLREVGSGFDAVVSVSVLHHVPDYLALLRRAAGLVVVGGTVLTVQDPLWYPRVGRPTRTLDRSAYLAWRVAQGNVRQGAAAAVRRLRGRHPSTDTGEITYYHVVRQGVDEVAVTELLDPLFGDVQLLRYWSHHVAGTQRVADAASLVNTFAVVATDLRPS